MDLSLILADLRELVECESPSADLEAVARSADVVARVGTARLGVAPERIVIDGRTHLRWRLGDGPSRVLVLGHHDTVWPMGSLATRPYSVEDGVLRGPGCFDMKAGVVMAFHAIASLADRDGVTILVTGDEELGSPSSRELIEDEARMAQAALVLEASADGGALKIERKGVSLYDVRLLGRAAHAGLEPELGVNATIELAHQVLAVAALGQHDAGTTVTPTASGSGTTTNTVPAAGSFAVDVRVRTVAEQDRVDAAMRSLRAVLPGAALEITGGPNRPPLDAESSAALYERACSLAVRLGQPVPGSAAVGGASDGNFTAGVGTPTLDGLGAVGGGAHADERARARRGAARPHAAAGRARRGPAGRPVVRDERPRADWCAPTMTSQENRSQHGCRDQPDHATRRRRPGPCRPGGRRCGAGVRRLGARGDRPRRPRRRGAALRHDLGPRRQPAGVASSCCARSPRPATTSAVRTTRTASWSARASASSTPRPRTRCTATSPASRRRWPGATSASRSSCTSAPGRCCAGSPRSPGPSTRWSAATRTSTWSSSAPSRSSTCRTSTARCSTPSTATTTPTGC